MKYYPWTGFPMMSWCGYIIAHRNKEAIKKVDINHENIHLAQAKESWCWISYYLKYLWGWLKLNPIFNLDAAYVMNKYEVEAYAKEYDETYLE